MPDRWTDRQADRQVDRHEQDRLAAVDGGSRKDTLQHNLDKHEDRVLGTQRNG
jgi:hypothetical protein